MKKLISFLAVFILFSVLINSNIFAQEAGTVMGISYDEIHSKYDKPMPYQFVREADVMWSKIIWRRIELKEKMNHILCLPKQRARNKMSLIDVILDGIHTKGLTAYKAAPDDAGNEFDIIMTEDQVHVDMGAMSEMQVIETLEGYDTIMVDNPYNSAEIDSYMLKEIWYFDKQRSVFEVRIIGMCPIRKYYRAEDQDMTNPLYKKVFWIHYPEARSLLAKRPVYNPNTDVANLTFDDIFQKRYFSSYIFMESNPYRRAIMEYESGLDVLLEAERIKTEIFNFEQDLWSY